MARIPESSFDEVWDDTALVASWDEALREYQRYHSIAARGERIPAELLDGTKISEELPEVNGVPKQAGVVNNSFGADNSHEIEHPGERHRSDAPPSAANISASSGQQSAPGLSGASMPQNLLGIGGQDESLKNLMMSWYYAGYYTGLYEGQQKAWSDMQPKT